MRRRCTSPTPTASTCWPMTWARTARCRAPRTSRSSRASSKPRTARSSGADGLAIDAQGRLYVASSAGVEVFDRDGKALGVIELPNAPQNLAFAGPDRRTLYVVGRGAVWKIRHAGQWSGQPARSDGHATDTLANRRDRLVSQRDKLARNQDSGTSNSAFDWAADDISLWTSRAMRVFLQRSQGDFVSVR